jgi:hypothetical protein
LNLMPACAPHGASQEQAHEVAVSAAPAGPQRIELMKPRAKPFGVQAIRDWTATQRSERQRRVERYRARSRRRPGRVRHAWRENPRERRRFRDALKAHLNAFSSSDPQGAPGVPLRAVASACGKRRPLRCLWRCCHSHHMHVMAYARRNWRSRVLALVAARCRRRSIKRHQDARVRVGAAMGPRTSWSRVSSYAAARGPTGQPADPAASCTALS